MKPSRRISRRLCAASLAAVFPLAGCGDTASKPAADGSKTEAKAAPAAPPKRTRTADAHGFNDAIAWTPLQQAIADSADTSMPLMLVVHASWCSKCKALAPSFGNPELQALSEKFIMVNVDQDATPESLQYAPDGTYIPRVLFFDPKTGEVDPELLNPVRNRFKYFYMPKDDLVGTMKKALERHGRS